MSRAGASCRSNAAPCFISHAIRLTVFDLVAFHASDHVVLAELQHSLHQRLWAMAVMAFGAPSFCRSLRAQCTLAAHQASVVHTKRKVGSNLRPPFWVTHAVRPPILATLA